MQGGRLVSDLAKTRGAASKAAEPEDNLDRERVGERHEEEEHEPGNPARALHHLRRLNQRPVLAQGRGRVAVLASCMLASYVLTPGMARRPVPMSVLQRLIADESTVAPPTARSREHTSVLA